MSIYISPIKIQNVYTSPTNPLMPFCCQSLHPQKITDMLSITIVLPVLKFHVKEDNIVCTLFCLASFISMMFWRFSHVFGSYQLSALLLSLFFLNQGNISLYKNSTICFISSPVDGRLGCFQFGGVMNKAVVNIFV